MAPARIRFGQSPTHKSARMLVLSACIASIVILPACTTTTTTRRLINQEFGSDGTVDTLSQTVVNGSSPIFAERGSASTFRKYKVGQIDASGTVNGLFVGVSDYGEIAGQVQQPGHFVGAAAMYQTLVAMAQRQPSAWSQNYYSSADGKVTISGKNRLQLIGNLGLGAPEQDELTLSVLQALDDLSFFPQDVPSSLMFPGPGWSFSRRVPLTRERFWTKVGEHVRSAKEQPVDPGKPSLVIVYIAAHGMIDATGRPFLLFHDAVRDDPSTWVSYESVLDRYRELQGKPNSILLFIFDSCEVGATDPPEDTELVIGTAFTRPGTVVVTSSSPGEPSWLLMGDAHVYSRVQSVPERGSPVARASSARDSRQIRSIDIRTQPEMSALPVAAMSILHDLSETSPEAGERSLSLQSWIESLPGTVNRLLQTGDPLRPRSQEVRIYLGPDLPDSFARPWFSADRQAQLNAM